jgi:hypothetical protein
MKKLYAVLMVLMLSMFGVPAFALDLTEVTTEFGTITTDLGTVGALVITAALVVVAYKWVRRMIGG